MSSKLAPVISLTHGGGPMPVLGDPRHRNIILSLKERIPSLLKLDTSERPRAIVVITAHWSATRPTISAAQNNNLYFDYGGFPPESYKFQYKAPGSPGVAEEVWKALRSQGFSPVLDYERGWDHGVFIPFMLIHPPADIPLIQLSVLLSESPEDHLKMGRALYELRSKNVAIVGSGSPSFHNIRLVFSGATEAPSFAAKFRDWNEALREAVTTEDPEHRFSELKKWRSLPHAALMHPQGASEHFMPLLVCAGAAGKEVASSFEDEFMGLGQWLFAWE